MFYVYILYSQKLNRYYVGYSENPEKRLEERHNCGRVKATKNGKPYILKAKKLFETEKHAIGEERRTNLKRKELKADLPAFLR